MNRSNRDCFLKDTPQYVVADAMLRRKKGRNLALQFHDVKNPRLALAAALDEQQRMGVDFGKRVAAAMKSLEDRNQGLKILAMQTLGEGMLVTHDNYGKGEYDVCFDPLYWGWRMAKIWKRELSHQEKEFGIRILSGVGRFPRVSSFEDALGFAREHLRPKRGSGAKFKPSPRQVVLE